MREVEAQVYGIDQRSGLLHVLAENLAQSRMKKMGRGVVAHGGFANVVVHDGVDFVSDADGLLGEDLMGAHALNRGIASGNVGDDGVVIVGVEPSAIADLSARLRVERSVIENDLAFFAGGEFLHA